MPLRSSSSRRPRHLIRSPFETVMEPSTLLPRLKRRFSGETHRKIGILFRFTLLVSVFVLFLGGAFFCLSQLFGWGQGSLGSLPKSRPSEIIFDPHRQLTVDAKRSLTKHLMQLNHSLQGDTVMILLNHPPKTPLQILARKVYAQWALGDQGMRERGAVLLVITHPEQVSLHVGPDLAGSFSQQPPLDPLLREDLLKSYLEMVFQKKAPLEQELHEALNGIEGTYSGRITPSTQGKRIETFRPFTPSSHQKRSTPLKASLVLPSESE